jgi:hypothetical protein
MEDAMRHRMAIVSSIAAGMLLSASSLALAQQAPTAAAPASHYSITGDAFVSPGGAALTGGGTVNGITGNVIGGVAGSAVRGVAGNVGHGPAGSAGDHHGR